MAQAHPRHARRVLREDRILHEIHTSGGDVRRICDLFGLIVAGALRYLPEPDIQGTESTGNHDRETH